MSPDNDIGAWARAHKASYATDALFEMRGAERIQVGFTLDLYALLPTEKGPGDERRQEGASIWGQLRTILESALGPERGKALVEIEPMRTAAVLRRETEMKPEVTLRARILHAEDTFGAVTKDERQALSVFEKKLVGMGLKAGHW